MPPEDEKTETVTTETEETVVETTETETAETETKDETPYTMDTARADSIAAFDKIMNPPDESVVDHKTEEVIHNDDTVSQDNDNETTAKDEAADDGSSPTLLPAAQIRSLKSMGWQDEDIDAAYKADPNGFSVSASLIHKQRAADIAEMSKLGREHKERETQSQQPVTEQPATVQPTLPTSPTALDVNAIKEELGDNDAVKQLIEVINAQQTRLDALTTETEGFATREQQVVQDAALKEVQKFFDHDDLKAYQEFYGTGVAVSDTQFANRQKVLENADALLVGAQIQGRPMTPQEALLESHSAG